MAISLRGSITDYSTFRLSWSSSTTSSSSLHFSHTFIPTSSSSLIPGDEPSGLSVPSLLTTPGDLKALDDCLGLLQIYVKGSAESHYWPRDPVNGFKNEDIVPTWCSPLMSAAWILGEGKVKEASVLLGAFMNQSPYWHLSTS